MTTYREVARWFERSQCTQRSQPTFCKPQLGFCQGEKFSYPPIGFLAQAEPDSNKHRDQIATVWAILRFRVYVALALSASQLGSKEESLVLRSLPSFDST